MASKQKTIDLDAALAAVPQRKGSVWQGPEKDGVTYSLLSRFLVCRERFRLLVVEGLRPRERFSAPLEFGNMWHAAEEGQERSSWKGPLDSYVADLRQRMPEAAEEITFWHQVVRVMFPLYQRRWEEDDTLRPKEKVAVLLREKPFSVPYTLPSGRTVRLRGKWDGVDLLGSSVWLREHKTKGDINAEQIQRQLAFDLQTMLYLVALDQCGVYMLTNHKYSAPIAGVVYNVVRRPRHRPGKKEGLTDFLVRLRGLIEEDPGHFFMRWRVDVLEADVAAFRQQCLDPVLEQLCDWWKFVSEGDPWSRPETPRDAFREYGIHWRHPFGVWNVLDEGGSSDLDHYLATGSDVGLVRTDNLFPELEQA
jgi:hypothetical protein